jgi:hypothetical protein
VPFSGSCSPWETGGSLSPKYIPHDTYLDDFTNYVMSTQRELDHLNLFSQPVCEVYPAITNEYLKVVNNPMDFCTIKEDIAE